MDSICQQCHATVAHSEDAAVNSTTCPACGGALIAGSRPDLNPAGSPPRVVDRRGIVLPRRHAVGGIITPR
ncbi:hypothetical protein [Acidicapsa acidisoli]|uniref:hypothetical protein n=1 Tax=Acidicapsa acidisoli TaxID=1615681 RepID=UPI0021DFE46C|nr:hypothetical protein [Acidicapsa acidisoli]